MQEVFFWSLRIVAGRKEMERLYYGLTQMNSSRVSSVLVVVQREMEF
jgi:hypothetical protein